MDDIDNDYLFGEKFEEKLVTVTNAEHKSRSVFNDLNNKTSLCRSSFDVSSHFVEAFYPWNVVSFF